MHERAFEQLLQSIGTSHGSASLIVLLMMMESAPVVGLFVPGVFVMVGLGSLSSTEYLSLPDGVILSVVGALLGDSIGYWMGRLGYAERLRRGAKGRRRRSWTGAEELLQRHGRMAVFLGRFIWFLHPAVPPIAGAAGIRPTWFYLADGLAVALWVSLYASIGHWATGVARQWTLELFAAVGIVLALLLIYLLVRAPRH